MHGPRELSTLQNYVCFKRETEVVGKLPQKQGLHYIQRKSAQVVEVVI
jgi:predicted transport protein